MASRSPPGRWGRPRGWPSGAAGARPLPAPPAAPARGLAFRPGGCRLLAFRAAGPLEEWDAATGGRDARSGPTDFGAAHAFSPDASQLAVVSKSDPRMVTLRD